MRHLYSLLAAGLLLAAAPVSAQITVANSGDWSDPTTWSSGAVPTASDDVVIDSTVTIDIADAVANNVRIVGDSGWLRTGRGVPGAEEKGLTVFGDLTIEGPDAQLRPLSNVDENDVGLGEIYHRLTVHGSIDNSTGGTFDMRRGSTSTTPADASFIDLIFAGGDDATLHLGDYDTDDNQLFRVEIAKENGATVTMLNDATVDNNSRAVFTLTSGYLDTGDYRFTLISNNSSVVVGGSPASYVLGEFARGLPKGTVGSQTSREFPLGDETGYRPATVYVTDRPSDDQFMGVRLVSEPAPSGTLEGGLMEVSPNRYYAFEWYFFDSADPISLDRVEVSYGNGDGVPEGSTDFVVATSTDEFLTWANEGGFDPDGTTAHVTTLASPPTPIGSGELTGWDFDFEVVGTDVVGDVYYAAVGTMGAFGTAAEAPVRGAFELAVAPNPAASDATVSFSLPDSRETSVEVFDVVGRRVATLAEGLLPAGDHTVTWEAATSAPGLYIVRLRAGAEAGVQTITLSR